MTRSLSVLAVGALINVAWVEESLRDDGDGDAVHVTFDAERAVSQGESFYVPYTVRHMSSDAISSAEIWNEIYDDERLVESTEIIVQVLPLQGKQDGACVTTHDPVTYPPHTRLESLLYR